MQISSVKELSKVKYIISSSFMQESF